MIATFIIGWIFAFPVYGFVENILLSGKKANIWISTKGILSILILVFSMIEIIAGSYNPFLYFQF